MSPDLRARALSALTACGAHAPKGTGADARSPIDGASLLEFGRPGAAHVAEAIGAAHAAFLEWRTVPAPIRGQLVKQFGRLLEQHKEDVADLITIEVGKIRAEALGEVQEMIDICDFAVGLSRQLEGRTMPSERPGHRLMETWHPAGVLAVISAFNFPAAVWSWNTAVALVCGDSVIWKPSELTPLTSLACSALLDRALVGPRVAGRFGRTILELGGNNAAVVTASADLDLALRGIVFAAAGTAGQRCTTMRRVIAHRSVHDELVERIARAYAGLRVGDPFDPETLVGPLINDAAWHRMERALDRAEQDGGVRVAGGERVDVAGPSSFYVRPALVTMPAQTGVVREETFAPLLYVLAYDDLDEAIALHNDVPQGLASSIFTLDQREAETFLSSAGSDCGIVNVNIGTSGAEIGGAFGGEKSTGGGRESGSDAWRGYMRRATNTINYSTSLPLAQGVTFG